MFKHFSLPIASSWATRHQGFRRKLQFEALEARTMLAVNVVPSVETAGAAGAVDDIAIWIHPTDPSQSRVIGTVKDSSSSLRTYNLQGQQVQSVSVPQVNNVDLRYNFSLGDETVTVLAGSNRSNNSIVLYRVDEPAGTLQNVAARTITTGMAIYGCAMYISPVTGRYYVFVSSESGQVQQWELFDNGAGKIDATRLRSFNVGSQVEGLVVDDVLGHLYVGEESDGIWKYFAEPDGGTTRTLVDRTGSGGHLTADVEGLTIYYAADGAGYLIASSQGSDEFVVYERGGGNDFVGSFRLVSGGGIDAVTDTDGIDVTNVPLGGAFPSGMFVAQDNDANFKLARWDAVDAAFGGSLLSDTTWNPRSVGSQSEPNPLPGDYDGSSVVDAADYVVWRKTLGTNGVPFYSGADGDGDGAIDGGDYDVWRAQFGETLPPLGAEGIAAQSADEPMAKTAPINFYGPDGEALSNTIERAKLPFLASSSIHRAVARDDALLASRASGKFRELGGEGEEWAVDTGASDRDPDGTEHPAIGHAFEALSKDFGNGHH